MVSAGFGSIFKLAISLVFIVWALLLFRITRLNILLDFSFSSVDLTKQKLKKIIQKYYLKNI